LTDPFLDEATKTIGQFWRRMPGAMAWLWKVNQNTQSCEWRRTRRLHCIHLALRRRGKATPPAFTPPLLLPKNRIETISLAVIISPSAATNQIKV